MKAIDWFSGIGGFRLGLEPLGIEFIAHSEVDPFANAVYKKHWPNSPNLGCIKSLAKRICGSEAGHVSRTPAPASNSKKKTSGIFGRICSPSFAWYDHDTSCWRTYHRSFLESDHSCSEFSETLPRCGYMSVSGELSEQMMSGLPIEGSGCGSSPRMWPTACANDDNKTPEAHMAMKRRMKGGPRNTITSLQVAVKASARPTATVGDSKSSGSRNTPESRAHAGISLTDAIRVDGGTGRSAGRQTRRMWQSPDTCGGGRTTKGSNRPNEGGLQSQVRESAWPTPQSRDGSHGGPQAKRYSDPKRSNDLDDAIAARSAGPTKGQLHACWVGWLMGYPMDWCSLTSEEWQPRSRTASTSCDASATPSSPKSSAGSESESSTDPAKNHAKVAGTGRSSG